MNFIESTKEKIHKSTSQYISHATLVEGALNDNQTFRCLFIENSNFMGYVTARTYATRPRVLKHWRVWIPSVDKILDNPPGELDMCIAVIPKRYDERFKEMFNFKCDECVGQVIDVSGTIEEIKKRFHQKKRQTANNILLKSGLTYRISRDLKDFDLFYHCMFLPLIKNKYGDISDVESYEEMKSFFSKGFLLLVFSGSQPVSGALCVVKGNALIFRRSGVLNGDTEYINIGAQHALYLFNIYHAKKLGLQSVDTMKSTSVMNDGVYRTKREWGAAVYPDDESKSWIYFFIPRYSEKIIEFFDRNPLIVHTKDGLCGLVGLKDNNMYVKENEKELYKRYYSPGLRNLLVLTPNSEKIITISFENNS
ncbi:MAG: hypothetical protein HZB37_02305 [Planctomycetes bacterium]|nr:hypothetical protein [Planctomycetota bacterium]